MKNPNYPLNRSKKWPHADTYKEAREKAIENGADIQHEQVK